MVNRLTRFGILVVLAGFLVGISAGLLTRLVANLDAARISSTVELGEALPAGNPPDFWDAFIRQRARPLSFSLQKFRAVNGVPSHLSNYVTGLAALQAGDVQLADITGKMLRPARPAWAATLSIISLHLRGDDLAALNLISEDGGADRFGQAQEQSAFFLERAGKTDQAIAAYSVAIPLLKNPIPAMLRLGNLYRGEQRFEEAEKIFEAALQIDPANLDAYLQIVEMWQQNNQYERAESWLNTLSENLPEKEATVLLWRGIGEYSRGDRDVAFSWFAQAKDLDPQNAQVLKWIGIYHLEMGDLDESKAALVEALRLDPAESGIRALLLKVFYLMEDCTAGLRLIDGALAATGKGLEVDPGLKTWIAACQN